MKTLLLTVLACLILSHATFAQSAIKWQSKGFEQKCFIQNQGQFNEKSTSIHYGVEDEGVQMYFFKDRVVYQIDTFRTLPKTKPEYEEELPKVEKYSYNLNIEWIGANPATVITALEKEKMYFIMLI